MSGPEERLAIQAALTALYNGRGVSDRQESLLSSVSPAVIKDAILSTVDLQYAMPLPPV